jgi:hypothetical protein
MSRLPNEHQLLTSIDFGVAFLERVKIHAPELLRRRQYEASDGFPASSLGGGGGGKGSSPTELAALAAAMHDPVARLIDIVLGAVEDIDRKAQHGDACLSNVLTAEQEMRGRVAVVQDCECCAATISGVGDDRRRDGFCPPCYKAWRRYVNGDRDPSRVIFIDRRRQELASRPKVA